MAGILDRYGIKEVADVTFYKLDENGKPTNPVLFLDTLKVSTIEQTGEQAEARGGKGNAPLIVWDYGKEINVTLEDALFSAKSLAIMFGNGTVATETEGSKYIMRTMQFTYSTDDAIPTQWEDNKGVKRDMVNAKYYDAAGNYVVTATTTSSTVGDSTVTVNTVPTAGFTAGQKYFCTYDISAEEIAAIEISATTFPGTYYVTGDTYARNEANGEDEFFQFIIPKAKVQSENTITLEAEGDPSVFNMSLRVLRPADGKMMKLVKYSVDYKELPESATIELIHNHSLDETKG